MSVKIRPSSPAVTVLNAPPARHTDASGRTTTTPAIDYPVCNGVTLRPGVAAYVVFTREEDDPLFASDPVTADRMTLVGIARRDGLVSFAQPLRNGDIAILDSNLDDADEMISTVFPYSPAGQRDALASAKKMSVDAALTNARNAYSRAGLVASAVTTHVDRATSAWDTAAPKEKTVMISALGGNPFLILKGTSGNPDASRTAFLALRSTAHVNRPTELRSAHATAIATRKSLVERFGEDVKRSVAEVREEKKEVARAARESKSIERLAANIDHAKSAVAQSLGLSPAEFSAILLAAVNKGGKNRKVK